MPRALRIATFLAPIIRPVYEAVAMRIGTELGRSVDLVVGESFAQFAAGELDAGFICGLPYIALMRGGSSPVVPVAAPVLRGERYGQRPIYFSDVIVSRESSYQRFADLRGASWAYNDVDSHSGYNLTRFQLVQMGETTGFFNRVVAAGFHQQAIELVAAGDIDGAAIDSQVLTVSLRNSPELWSKIRVIDTFGPSTIQPFVVASHLPTSLKRAIRSVVLAVGDEPVERRALDSGMVERFVPVGDADYDDIRTMLASVEAAGFLELR